MMNVKHQVNIKSEIPTMKTVPICIQIMRSIIYIIMENS